MKIIPIIMLTILLITAIVIATVDSNGMVPSAMAEGTQDIINLIKSDNESTYDKIQKNIDKTTELKTLIETLRAEGEPTDLNAIIKDIEDVTKSYESLASQRDNIKDNLLGKINKIQDMQKNIGVEIDKLNDRKVEYITQYNEPSDNPEIARSRQKALTKAIAYIDKQIALWQQFKAIEGDIAEELLGIQDTLDEFLSVIESSAILYREGLNLLYLQQDIGNALSLFTVDIPQMKRLSSDMESSWDNLDFLVNSLTSLSVSIK